MGEPDDPSLPRSVKSKAAAALGLARKADTQPVLPTNHSHTSPPRGASDASSANEKPALAANNAAHPQNGTLPPDHNTQGDGDAASTIESQKRPLWSATRMKNGTMRFLNHTKNALTHSWINLLLVFVPVGIVVKCIGLSSEIVFSMNAIAIIPLAGLLAHATEVVAERVGDTLGALLNVSFGNAVELILFIILLASNQIEVVQASLLGSILANLLLIMGMAFLLGGLKFQEQVYNNTVTQMSGVMLALAVMSLLLPTAFHAAFKDYTIADHETLYVSRGTSVILLIVYGLYLLFQLKSHRYLYASTPQHIIDEESHPGVLAGAFDSSSSSSSSSSSDDSDNSSNSSNTTMKRKAKRMVKRLRRKSSASSKEAMSALSVGSHQGAARSGSIATNATTSHAVFDDPAMSGDEADDDRHAPIVRDFEVASSASLPYTKRERHRHREKGKGKKHRKHASESGIDEKQDETKPKVAFAQPAQQDAAVAPATSTARRPYRPALPSLLSNNVFSNPQNVAPIGPAPNIRMAAPREVPRPKEQLRRTMSMPERMNRSQSQSNVNNGPAPLQQAAISHHDTDDDDDHAPDMSIKAAIFMLLISTGLVAVCADFMSDAIEPMVESSGISQAFIGLIILPIVGNAAEHVTAVTVAMKNKMDLSIGIAVGSSIQIAIFITPVIVILGWIMGKEMTLYFNIFETVALFVTVLVVNFLVLDGRSNYLEGSLLIAAYVIIALASFFYPDGCAASAIGGNEKVCQNGQVAAAAHMLAKRFGVV
jgi:Ca2+:H+ antiporter